MRSSALAAGAAADPVALDACAAEDGVFTGSDGTVACGGGAMTGGSHAVTRSESCGTGGEALSVLAPLLGATEPCELDSNVATSVLSPEIAEGPSVLSAFRRRRGGRVYGSADAATGPAHATATVKSGAVEVSNSVATTF